MADDTVKDKGSTLKPAPQPANHGQLLLLDRGVVIATFPVGSDPVVLGRDPDVTIPILKPHVSRRHATLSWQSGYIVLQDHNSNNGTYVNECRITRQAIRPGDVLRLGSTVLLYTVASAPVRAKGWILVRYADGEMTLPLTERPILIGRSEQADIQVREEGVAEFHALLLAEGKHARLIRLNSDPLRATRLTDKSRVSIGGMVLRVFMGEAIPWHANPSEETPDAEGSKPRARREPSVVLNRRCGDATLMAALYHESARVDDEESSVFTAAVDDEESESGELAEEESEGGELADDESEIVVAAAEDDEEDGDETPVLKLTVTRGRAVGMTFNLPTGLSVLGSSPQADIRLEDECVMPQHVQFRVEGKAVIIEDLETAIGLLVNGRTAARQPLHPGDTIRLGNVEILVHL